MNKKYDVVILGAGPAGSSCALALRNTGLKVAIIDKSKFPRNKTCGDAIPGPSIKYLMEIFNEFLPEFSGFKHKQKINSSVLYLTNKRSIEIDWKTDAYNSKRSSFDNFLLTLVKKHTDTAVYEGMFVEDILKNDRGIKIKTRLTGVGFDCDMLIGSDGANSIVSRKLGISGSYKQNNAVAVSAYYENVDSIDDSNMFFFIKDILGYFWIFPVSDNLYNVGFGMLTQPSSKKINLKRYFLEIISNHPKISTKFRKAKAISGVKGFTLPLAGKNINISGDRFLLTGDAAHLIDPLGGHGIDKAIKSGMLAAKHIEKCFKERNFSSHFNKHYDVYIYKALGKELKRNFQLLKLFSRLPWLMNTLWLVLKCRNKIFLNNEKRLATKYKAH